MEASGWRPFSQMNVLGGEDPSPFLGPNLQGEITDATGVEAGTREPSCSKERRVACSRLLDQPPSSGPGGMLV